MTRAAPPPSLVDSVRGAEVAKPFQFLSLGILAYTGAGRALAQVFRLPLLPRCVPHSACCCRGERSRQDLLRTWTQGAPPARVLLPRRAPSPESWPTCYSKVAVGLRPAARLHVWVRVPGPPWT